MSNGVMNVLLSEDREFDLSIPLHDLEISFVSMIYELSSVGKVLRRCFGLDLDLICVLN